MGKEERVLFEKKDWNKELEDLKPYEDAFNTKFHVE